MAACQQARHQVAPVNAAGAQHRDRQAHAAWPV
jgi:hypothetical protein